MTIQEMLEDFREKMCLFDADGSREFLGQGFLNRRIIKIEELL